MTPEDFYHRILQPGLEFCASVGGPVMSADAARFLLAVCKQESDLMHRYQLGVGNHPGPARGWAQFERGGGVAGVMLHPVSRQTVVRACERLGVHFEAGAIWRAIEGNDDLAVTLARMLLRTDPQAIPTTQAAAWDCYLRLWRPGKPHPDKWPEAWRAASSVVPANPVPA